MNYVCPKCHGTMCPESIMTNPPIHFYHCLNCGYESKYMRETYPANILPKEWQREEKTE